MSTAYGPGAPPTTPGAHADFTGIRYFAFPVSERQIAQSRECPRGCFDGSDSWDRWGPGDAPTLSLEKCYPELQQLLGGSDPRPALALVEGSVTHTPYGWRPYSKILDVAEARAIADDLDALLADPEHIPAIGCRFGDEEDCAPGNLIRARDFARQVSDAGFGIHYRIG
ncbi:MAG: hypothetical protein JST25_10485 [Actinobacteria bacterium]|nr:hypothetical protein [Actinomycetota bacterium]